MGRRNRERRTGALIALLADTPYELGAELAERGRVEVGLSLAISKRQSGAEVIAPS